MKNIFGKICVIGLGLIGGSICKSLRRAGLSAVGFDANKQTLDEAVRSGVISDVCDDFTDFDLVLVALPPEPTKRFISETDFKPGAIVADVCGVKKPIEDTVLAAPRRFKYIGTHPMAGRETSGLSSSDAALFDGASLVLTHNAKTDGGAYAVMTELARVLGFARIVRCTAEVHDKKIAYTSQLAHVVSNCYVNDGEINGCFGFTGGSFQDMTRIAGVDEDMWAALYLENADNLLEKVDNLDNMLRVFRTALDKARRENDPRPLREFLSVGANTFRAGKDMRFVGGDITVIELKK